MVVETDRRALSQILINLTNNAIKFTDAGTITLQVQQYAGNGSSHINFIVADTGIGIKPEDQLRLFQAFEQVREPSSRRHEGTGLGLHLSQKLADLLGGQITFTSEYGKGSTFKLALPGR
ncbi:MAG: hypothetical protein HY231_03305 [Acidobacteria bacterium]|nr:hypothetical protein [Acidobacteriota bacterium]